MTTIPTLSKGDFIVVTHDRFNQYKINIGPRQLEPKQDTIDSIAENVMVEGVLMPILVNSTSSEHPLEYDLVDGYHRLHAVQKVWASLPEADRINYPLPIRIVHISGADARPNQMEAAANLFRNHLTQQERATLAHLVGRQQLAKRVADLRVNDPQIKDAPKLARGRQETWFAQWHDAAHIAKKTAQRAWADFCTDAGLGVTPGEATVEQQDAFFAWYEKNKVAAKAPKLKGVPAAPDPAAAAREAQKALYQRRMTASTAKTGVSQQVINAKWKKHFGKDPVPSAASDAQWDEFEAAFVASIPAAKQIAPDVVFKTATEVYREAVATAKAAGVNVGSVIRDLIAEV